ncbi:MAG: PAS domain S-box protein [Oligoflexia bacterium]|nr:PAS domain S-box protein [Oligoflexia bacterium]
MAGLDRGDTQLKEVTDDKAVSPTNPETLPQTEIKKRRRERVTIVVLGVLFCLLTFLEIYLSNISHRLPFVNSIFFFGLVNFNVALLLFLAFLIFRNFAKVFSEKRGGFLGTRLQSKLIIAFVSFALVPTILLFLVSVFYINSSFDKWFSLKIGSVLQDSLEVTNNYYLATKKRSFHFGKRIAEEIGRHPYQIQKTIQKLGSEYSLDVIEYYPALFERPYLTVSKEIGLKEVPGASAEFLDKGIRQRAEASMIHSFGKGNLIRCIVPVPRTGGAVVVSTFVSLSLVSKMDVIASAFEEYRDVNPLKYPIKSIYLIILGLVTLLIFFGASWFGFHLARQLSHPLQILGKATEEIAHGQYRPVDVRSGSIEIFQLVENFNKMVADLARSEKDLLRHSRYIGIILSNISAGVVSIDQEGHITTINQYAGNLLGIDPVRYVGSQYKDVLTGAHQAMFNELIQTINKHRAQSIQREYRLNIKGENIILQATLSPLKDGQGASLGYVLVFDDLTKMIHAQRASAWREVARRIAHEIKNPLTPIQLSAERLQKKFGHIVNDDAFESCTKTIVQQVEELKHLVNEFSSFARMPQALPMPNNLNDIVSESLVLFKEGHKNIQFTAQLDPQLPVFDFDREQIKRALLNLLSNAVAALEGKVGGSVAITTQYDSVLRIARCTVADNGVGIPVEVRDRVFEPYFSTKPSGTGLGLAIVKRIVDDHQGFVRVYQNQPEGVRFVIELPANATIGPKTRTDRSLDQLDA